MIYKIRLHASASEDIIGIYSYYEELTVGLGEKFYAEFRDITNLLTFFPKMYKLHPSYKSRVGVMRSFPYLVFYFIQKDVIYIAGIFSAHQSPKGHKKILKARK